jgi:serine/threonine protein kinase
MFSDGLTLKIIDFGLACWDLDETPLYPDCGTVGFLAPEIFRRDKNYSVKIDVFSAGAIFYKM